MHIDDPKIVSLTRRFEAACEEVDMAIQFHEAWKPAAFDQSLLDRVGHSYAGNTFHVIRTALRREVILALMRLWDNDRRAVNLRLIADDLADPELIAALAADRAQRIPIPAIGQVIRRDLVDNANACRSLIARYLPNGSRADVLERLRAVRNRHLAHRQMTPIDIAEPDPDRDDVEELYQDMMELMGRLYSLVKGIAYRMTETAEIQERYADLFWAAVRGERTEGHPRY